VSKPSAPRKSFPGSNNPPARIDNGFPQFPGELSLALIGNPLAGQILTDQPEFFTFFVNSDTRAAQIDL
jgi:hypothetical protein